MNREQRRAHAKEGCTWKDLRSANPNDPTTPVVEFCIVCNCHRPKAPQP